MTALENLDASNCIDCLIVAVILGTWASSFLVFLVTAAVLLACCFFEGSLGLGMTE